MKDNHWLWKIQNYLKENAPGYEDNLPLKKQDSYSINDHLKAMVYALLSNQRSWNALKKPHLAEVDKIFSNYVPDDIIDADSADLCKKLKKIKCGNRAVMRRIEALKNNVKVLKKMEKEYGSVDAFVNSCEPGEVVSKLVGPDSELKLQMMDKPLVWQYLRNVGIDGVEPDPHLRRFLGADRMGTEEAHSPATTEEVQAQVDAISKETGLSKNEVDNLIWSFCSKGKGQVCGASPLCGKCPISQYCKYPNRTVDKKGKKKNKHIVKGGKPMAKILDEYGKYLDLVSEKILANKVQKNKDAKESENSNNGNAKDNESKQLGDNNHTGPNQNCKELVGGIHTLNSDFCKIIELESERKKTSRRTIFLSILTAVLSCWLLRTITFLICYCVLKHI